MTTGDRIKALRLLNGWTQKELGARMNMTQSAVGQFETGKNFPKAVTLQKFAAALHTSPEFLMGWSDGPIPETDNPVYAAKAAAILDVPPSFLMGTGTEIEFLPDSMKQLDECNEDNDTIAWLLKAFICSTKRGSKRPWSGFGSWNRSRRIGKTGAGRRKMKKWRRKAFHSMTLYARR